MKLIDRMSVATCRSIILTASFHRRSSSSRTSPAGRKAADGSTIGTGGKTYTMASGKQLWLYTFRDTYAGVAGSGANRLHIVSPTTSISRDIASHDIQTRTGVVHSLQYDFTPTDF